MAKEGKRGAKAMPSRRRSALGPRASSSPFHHSATHTEDPSLTTSCVSSQRHCTRDEAARQRLSKRHFTLPKARR
ncbi:hypothetical protein VFPFJ_03000 [Purpureocillium lilacinum]|uniref:Uncharacterized protein n=1 Tax=Purpureocillium lilacinum TaxID=33203 RepID=A0A179HTY8_PURLI|nr:hypothetical protein VFPFJ_03000 [Purpureocillium lilacinum]OAQ93837.1 hypothetical protein VFPFJ_03000 [Purpureocillium lilacinum]